MLSAGVIPMAPPSSEAPGSRERFLLLRAYRHWDFPKGMVEEGEEPPAAALRELTEETGLASVELAWGHDYYQTEAYSRGKRARYYLGRTEQHEVVLPVNEELGRPEHDEFRWVSAQEAEALLVPRVCAALRWALQKLAGRDA